MAILESRYFLNYAKNAATGMTILNLWLKAMNEFEIPCPPLSEQSRIVEKINQLFAHFDALETATKNASADSERLLESILGKAFRFES